MNGFEIAIIVIFGVNLLIGAHQHGKSKTGEHSFWINLFATAINFALLYGAGLFR